MSGGGGHAPGSTHDVNCEVYSSSATTGHGDEEADALEDSDVDALPVVDTDGGSLVDWDRDRVGARVLVL
jgi:hypothetical protein